MNLLRIRELKNYGFLAIAVLSVVAVFLLTGSTGVAVDRDPGTVAYIAYYAPVIRGGTKTLENLQTAFNGESNAHAKYLAYAKRADAEGYTKVGSLFRAAARAEEIHAANHAIVIRKLGGDPTADIKLPEIRTTRENLEDAVKGETYERDIMYPEFVKEARDVKNTEALLTFNFAKSAEAEHAKLYSQALATLEEQRGGTTTYFVCPKCGYTTSDPKLKTCPVDRTPKEKFEAIS